MAFKTATLVKAEELRFTTTPVDVPVPVPPMLAPTIPSVERVSEPLVPSMMSPPLPPTSVSLPAPPVIVSAPVEP